jgi:protein-S-isoprenylcysteine O-methyltransferase Ste14
MDFKRRKKMESLTKVESSPWWEKYRVRLGFAFAIVFVWRGQPKHLIFLILGLGIAAIGIVLRQWAAGCVKKMNTLATGGPYAFVRHPLYLGSFLAGFGLILTTSSFALSLASPNLERTLLFWVLFFLFIEWVYKPKIAKEEELLHQKFQNSFKTYVETVPALFPKKIQWSKLDFKTFQWSVWKKNKEYQSLLGYSVLASFLILRYSFNV